jgi:hypothetical protein
VLKASIANRSYEDGYRSFFGRMMWGRIMELHMILPVIILPTKILPAL